MIKCKIKKIQNKVIVRLPIRKRWEQTKTFYHCSGLVNVVFCGKVFQNKSRLSTHIHENSGAFPCETCNRKFPSESTLFDHVKLVHTKVSCELCNEVLYNKFYLKRHKAAVHGIIPQDSFKCIACPMFFKAEKSLISHVKSKH